MSYLEKVEKICKAFPVMKEDLLRLYGEGQYLDVFNHKSYYIITSFINDHLDVQVFKENEMVTSPELVDKCCRQLLIDARSGLLNLLRKEWEKQQLRQFAKKLDIDFMLNDGCLTDDELIVKDILE